MGRVEQHQLWTPEMDAIALRLIADGKSRAEVGKTLGKSRNAVIGRLLRLAQAGAKIPEYKRPRKVAAVMPQRPSTPRVPKAAKATRAAEKVAVKANTGAGVYNPGKGEQKAWRPVDMAVFTPLADGEHPRLVGRPPFTCAWPVDGEGAETLCCGQVATDGPYCPAHRRMAYVPTAPLDKRLFRRYA